MIGELVCALARRHRWKAFPEHPTMRYAHREFCERCEVNRIVFEDGDELVVPRWEVVNLSPRWLEGLYRARWRELPKQHVTIGGEVPPEWGW